MRDGLMGQNGAKTPVAGAVALGGYYGKVPVNGDFVGGGWPRWVEDQLDPWLRAAVRASQTELGRGWLDAFLVTPVWHFAIAPGIVGPASLLGVMMPSVDRVGRYFPLTIGVAVPAHLRTALESVEGQDLFGRAESLALSTLDPNFKMASFDAAVAALPAPGPVTQASPASNRAGDSDESKGISYWWTKGQEPQGFTGLPAPEHFACLFMNPQRHKDVSVVERTAASSAGSDRSPEPKTADPAPAAPQSSPQSSAPPTDRPVDRAEGFAEPPAPAPVPPATTQSTTPPTPVPQSSPTAGNPPESPTEQPVLRADPGQQTGERPAASMTSHRHLLALSSAEASLKGARSAALTDLTVTAAEGQAFTLLSGLGQDLGLPTALSSLKPMLESIAHPFAMNDLIAEAKGKLGSANATLSARATASGQSCAASAVTLLIQAQRYAVLWAGSARAVLLRDEALAPLTRPHMDPRLRNIVTRALGAGPNLGLDTAIGQVLPGDRFLLLSPGLYDTLGPHEIGETLRIARNPQEAVTRMTQNALIAGAALDTSAVAVFAHARETQDV